MGLDCPRKFGKGHNAAARSANAARVGRVRQLFYVFRGLLDKLDYFAVLGMVVLRNTGSIRSMMVVGFELLAVFGLKAESHAAKKHGCGGKALQGQSQHHQAKKQVAKARHHFEILMLLLNSV